MVFATRPIHVLMVFFILVTAGCQTQSVSENTSQQAVVNTASVGKQDVNKLLIVDCLLPSQVRTVGSSMTYLTPRRPLKTSAVDCEIRGGEYVSYDRADYRTALNVWIEPARQGEAEAQVNVGEIFEKGLGTEPNYSLAAEWYRKAALQGNSRAAINLGFLYEKGLGVEKNSAESLNWYRKASGLEDDDLQFASTIEAKSEQKLGKLNEELEQSKKAVAELQKKLNDTQQALNEKQEALEKFELELKNLKQDEKSQQKLELQQRKQHINDLKAEATGYQNKLNKLATANEGPSIELLDPPLTLTRGIPSVRLRSTIKERIIVGKATAPAGISSLTVNNKQEHLDSFGIFQVPVQITGNTTHVSVVAFDTLGQSATINFQLVPYADTATMAETAPAPEIKKSTKSLDPVPIAFGNYHALIIGNNSYANFPQLESAINDAKIVEHVLKNQYGFKTQLLLNADRYTILSALSELRNKLTETDNFLIYYAGHGELDSSNSRGHWLPVDAEQNNPANWISNTDITDIINTFAAKHVLVVADSCYAGALTRSSLARRAPDLPDDLRMKWYKVMAASRSRTALTSGGLEPVADTGSSNHSIFAKAFLDTLQNNDSIAEAYNIFLQVLDKVEKDAAKLKIEQTPQYAPIRHSGHESGEFLFVPKDMQSKT